MSLEHSPARSGIVSAAAAGTQAQPEHEIFQDQHFWFSLIDETEAGKFLGLERRTMQAMRQRGGGPRFVRISSRCIKYRRADLRAWSEARLVASTAEATPET